MRRTRPKTSPDPGWERCSWDEALDLIAATLLEVRASSGAHTVAFNKGTTGARRSPTPSAGCSAHQSLRHPEHRRHGPISASGRVTRPARTTTFGTPALPMPDVARSACIVVWGSNPNGNFLTLATDIAAAKARGARLLVVDPRRVGLANKADVWLQVRRAPTARWRSAHSPADAATAVTTSNSCASGPTHRSWCGTDTGMLLTGADLDGVPSTGRRHVAAIDGSSSSSSTTPSGASMRWTCRWP